MVGMNNELERTWKENYRALIEVLSRNFSREIVEYDTKPQSKCLRNS
jgi:hypothetical protein